MLNKQNDSVISSSVVQKPMPYYLNFFLKAAEYSSPPHLFLRKITFKGNLFHVKEGVYNFLKSNSQVYNFTYKLHFTILD